MNRLLAALGVAFLLISAPAVAQGLPELGVQASGTCRNVTIRDKSGAQVPLGCVNDTSHVWALPAQTSVNCVASPSFPESSGTLGRCLGFDSGATTVIPTLKELDGIRWVQDFNIGASSGNGAGGQAALVNFQLSLNASSDHSANLYGVIGQVFNNGKGSVKAIYGRADCTNVVADSTYATCIGGVFNVNTGVNSNWTANIQANAVTNVSGKAADAGFWLHSANSDGVGGNPPAAYKYGILMQNVAIQAGGSAFQASAIGTGDFLTFNNAAGSAHLFNVDSGGNIGVMGNVAAMGNIASVGNITTGVQSTIALSNGTRTFGWQGVTSGDYFRLLISGLGEAVQVSNSGAWTFPVTVTAGTAANGMQLTPAGIARTAPAGSATLSAGTNAGNTFAIQTGGVSRAAISDTNLNVVPTTAATSTSTGALTVQGGAGVAGAMWAGSYGVGTTAGATCSSGLSASSRVINGIVTTC